MERILSKTNVGIILTDIILLTVIYFLPTISHLIGFPLYLLDPMRIVVLGSLLILGNKKTPIY